MTAEKGASFDGRLVCQTTVLVRCSSAFNFVASNSITGNSSATINTSAATADAAMSNRQRASRFLIISFLWFSSDSPDQPDTHRDQEDEPPEVAELACGHFHERIRPREEQHERAGHHH